MVTVGGIVGESLLFHSQPVKVYPAAGMAVKVTTVPEA
jgi:capsule polysaccharide modification protein KpsS